MQDIDETLLRMNVLWEVIWNTMLCSSFLGYCLATNFSIQNADKEIAPYIALTELYNANIKLLDTVNNSLTNEIKASKYGVELEKFINDIRKKE